MLAHSGYDGKMIVVVEGASAAGKTTWAERHSGPGLLPESASTDAVPDRASDAEGWTRYWHEQNEKRWRRALELEREVRLVVCDTDPLKAHYVWCLWQAGIAERREWELERELCAVSFRGGSLGFADLVFFADLEENELRSHRGADTTRQRRGFEMHVRLAEPLRRWYTAVDRLEPGRVIWRLPSAGFSADVAQFGARHERSGPAIFAQFLSELEMVTKPGG